MPHNNMPGDRVLLATVQELTFIRNHMTTSRRTRAVPQLVCDDSGSAGCPNQKEYQFSSAVCDNIGIGDNGQPMWACTASLLPPDVWLGSIMVSCEGYSRSTDPYVLRGSCQLQYTLDGDPHPKAGFLAGLFLIFGFLCCCGIASKKKGTFGRSPPPPSYHADYISAAPVMATAVPVDSQSTFTESTATSSSAASYQQTGYDPESAGKTGHTPVTSSSSVTSTAAKVGTAAAVVGAAAAAGGVVAAAVASRKNHAGDTNHDLPKDWEARVDRTTGRTYYVNHNTRQTTWTHPTIRLPSEQQSLLNSHNDDNAHGGNAGWGGVFGANNNNYNNNNWGAAGHTGGTAFGGTHNRIGNSGTTPQGADGSNTAVGGTQNRGGDSGGGGWLSFFGGGERSTSSTAVGGTQNRDGWGGSSGGGSTAVGGTQNRAGSGGGSATGGTQNRGGGGGWSWSGGGGGSSTAIGGSHNRGGGHSGGFGGTGNR